MKKSRRTTARRDAVETTAEIFHRLGNPATDDGLFVWKIAWLVDRGWLPRLAVYTAASGPKMVRGVRNPVAYFHASLRNDIGVKTLNRALRRLPRSREWPTQNPNLERCRIELTPVFRRGESPPARTQAQLLADLAQAVRDCHAT